MTGAALNRHRSEQDVQTPREFLDAVEERFGEIVFDLAATSENCVVRAHRERGNIYVSERFFGPGANWSEDALSVDWDALRGNRWLNPPFANIAPWAAKCETQRLLDRWTLLLVPASVGTKWWNDHVHDKAMVYFLAPRLKFVGHTQSYPKDLALCAYGFGVRGYTTWRWK